MIIAIDGPAGSGKTTTARKVAQILGFIHINTGSMYRGIALKFIREKVNLDDILSIERILNNTKLDFAGPKNAILYMDGEDISAEIISSMVTENVSQISSISEVRVKLVEYQRKMAQGRNVVLEGRDIGTVVFPDADYKFYLIADIEVRAKRRKKELEDAGEHISITGVYTEYYSLSELDDLIVLINSKYTKGVIISHGSCLWNMIDLPSYSHKRGLNQGPVGAKGAQESGLSTDSWS